MSAETTAESRHDAKPTHEVVRGTITGAEGVVYRPGDKIDTSAWSPRLLHLWVQRGSIRALGAGRQTRATT
ncbi:MAG: hypothetical protein IT357_12765 [Gemmatimonadaceae bacterium]|nr:hypothetical protein [Gemmatimonadaceae bacterium]